MVNQSARQRNIYKYPEGAVCSITDCNARPRAKGWCEKHYARWLRHRDPQQRVHVANGEYKGTCSVSGCANERICKGLCASCYDRERYQQNGHRSSREVQRAGEQLRRARKYQPRAHPFTAAQWAYIQSLCGHLCVYCRQRTEKLEQDHIVPLSQGGFHISSNIVPACRSCNASKRTTPVTTFMAA